LGVKNDSGEPSILKEAGVIVASGGHLRLV
jgi:hypothetical protein